MLLSECINLYQSVLLHIIGYKSETKETG